MSPNNKKQGNINRMKRVFGIFEVVFDLLYLAFGAVAIFIFFSTATNTNIRFLAGVMTVILIIGDSFHLVPRMLVILSKDEVKFRSHLGIGKQITSITMTVFYIYLWNISKQVYSFQSEPLDFLIYSLAIIRILICLLPQNKWKERRPPVKWGIYRNIPFFILGLTVSLLFFVNRNLIPAFGSMYLAILLSFVFYLPVVLYSNKNPKIGMLMLPKTCMYVWIVSMCFSI